MKLFRNIKDVPNFVYKILGLIIKLWRKSLRFEICDPSNMYNSEKPFVLTFWHNKLLFMALSLSSTTVDKLFAMVSPSRDGEYISKLLAEFRVKTVRGSTSKRAAGALIEAIKLSRSGNNIALTPDGPRGPLYTVHPGAIIIASKTGVPIVPVSINFSSFWTLKSWDKFQIPKPFCKLTMVIGEPIIIPKKLNEDEMEKYQSILKERLMEISED